MTACNLLDVACHLNNVLFGWISLVPWWGWAAAGLVLVGIVWKIAGWPGILALAAAAGFILGRRSNDPGHEHVDGADASTPFRRKPRTGAKNEPVQTNQPGTWNSKEDRWNE